jgi:hypothetical protein
VPSLVVVIACLLIFPGAKPNPAVATPHLPSEESHAGAEATPRLPGHPRKPLKATSRGGRFGNGAQSERQRPDRADSRSGRDAQCRAARDTPSAAQALSMISALPIPGGSRW